MIFAHLFVDISWSWIELKFRGLIWKRNLIWSHFRRETFPKMKTFCYVSILSSLFHACVAFCPRVTPAPFNQTLIEGRWFELRRSRAMNSDKDDVKYCDSVDISFFNRTLSTRERVRSECWNWVTIFLSVQGYPSLNICKTSETSICVKSSLNLFLQLTTLKNLKRPKKDTKKFGVVMKILHVFWNCTHVFCKILHGVFDWGKSAK